MSNLVSQVVRFVFKLFLALFAILFAVSLLCAALIAFAVSLITGLITGKKPASAVVFSRFQQFSRQGIWPVNPAGTNAHRASPGQVVDVEARDITEESRKP